MKFADSEIIRLLKQILGASGGGAAAVWGAITGTLSSQTDLQTALNAKASSSQSVTQTAHGLSVKDLVRHNGTAYVKAQADSETNAEVIGIVSAVASANAFSISTFGNVTGLSGLTAGATYFLDPTTAGALTATEPSAVGQVSKPVFIAISTTAGYFFNMRGALIEASASGGVIGAVSFDPGDPTANIVAAGVIASVSFVSTGRYQVAFSSDQSDTDYGINLTVVETSPSFITVSEKNAGNFTFRRFDTLGMEAEFSNRVTVQVARH